MGTKLTGCQRVGCRLTPHASEVNRDSTSSRVQSLRVHCPSTLAGFWSTMLSGHHGATRTCAHRPLKARSSWYRQSQPVGASTRFPPRAKCLRRDQLSSLRFWQSYLQWWAARPPKNALRAPSIAVTIPSGLQVTRAKRGPGTAVTGDALRMSRYKRAFSSFVRAAHCHARSATLRETRRVSDASKRVQNRAPVRKDRACGARIHDGLGEPERGYTRIRGALSPSSDRGRASTEDR